jgi:hypothetical protein
MIVVTAFISPYRADRDSVRAIAPELFHEVHVQADLATCEQRDPKGLYAKARAGKIAEFTGISAPYEAPEAAELVIDTAGNGLEACLGLLAEYVERHLRAEIRPETRRRLRGLNTAWRGPPDAAAARRPGRGGSSRRSAARRSRRGSGLPHAA